LEVILQTYTIKSVIVLYYREKYLTLYRWCYNSTTN